MKLHKVLLAVALGTPLLMPVTEVLAQQRPPSGTTVGGGQTGRTLSPPAKNVKAPESVRPRSTTQKWEPDSAATMTAIAQAESHKNKPVKAKRPGTGTKAGVNRPKLDCEGYTVMGATAADSCAEK